MFGLSVEHLLILMVAALFIIGPERLPGAVAWLGEAIRKARGMANSAREQLTAELGGEFEELRKPLQELGALRRVDPRAAVTRFLLEDEPAAPPAPTVQAPRPAGSAAVDMEAT
ncbi:Sec-independent protein translocase protein TatB [Amycolatopsis sp. H20-H5]|uniref:Sec-independent protein translocase protein TatB n=1 Tax=Amycolatopsis sp. H20-H5 TaxID=3046309 RepID=UPI002DB9C217|nr:Sec-independent protein translocase protein TatB [Amycolatopsis sp. H20-H5]MEC3980725.1 Sec-independent protein translocase protein TatB [Amycolatopsis sp. H20-H5]